MTTARRWTGAAATALCITLVAAPSALGAPAPRPPLGGSATEPHPSDTAPSPVWSAARVGAGLRTAWTAPDVQNVYAETAGTTLGLDGSFHLTGLATATGAKLWSIDSPPAQIITVDAADGRFFVGTGEVGPGAITAIDAKTGATDWSVATAQGIVQAVDGRLLQSYADVDNPDGEVAALDPATGHTLWTQTGAQHLQGGAGRVYTVGSRVSGLDPATGAVLWSSGALPAGYGAAGSEALSSGRFWLRLAPLQPNSTAPQIDQVYDGATGALVWSQYAVDGTMLPESVGGVGYQPGSNDRLWAIDEATGHAVWVGSNGLPLTWDTVAVGPGAVLVGCGPPDDADDTADFVCGFDRSNGAPLSTTYVGPLLDGYAHWLLAGDDLIVQANGGVTALTPADLLPVPGKVEAESTLSPALRGPATDTGGGQLVGLFPPGGTILDYPVNVASAGTYTVTFRVASDGASLTPPNDPQLQLQLAGVGTLATVTVPQTGGWQTWQSVSATVTLPAGAHRLRIYIPAGHQAFNINWFDVEHSTLARASRPLPRTTPAQRRTACLAGLKPSAQLTAAAIAADCTGV